MEGENKACLEGKVQVGVCDVCHCDFVFDTSTLDWKEEPFDPKLGYRTWKSLCYCVRCGEPTSLWKRSGEVEDEGNKEQVNIVDELTSKTHVINKVSYVKTSDYAKACSVALELNRKCKKRAREAAELRTTIAVLEAENTRKTGEIIRLAHRPDEYVTGFY